MADLLQDVVSLVCMSTFPRLDGDVDRRTLSHCTVPMFSGRVATGHEPATVKPFFCRAR